MGNDAITGDMSDVLVIDDGLASGKTLLKQALVRGSSIAQFHWDPERPSQQAAAAELIHEAAFHCGKLTDFCNRMLDEIWPLLRADIYQDYLNRHVATPIVAMDRLVHPTPWDWDIQACEGCGKMVGTPVLKKRRAWLGNKYCYGCEQRLLEN